MFDNVSVLLTLGSVKRDTTCCGAHKGGMWWDVAQTSKATASNFGSALALGRMAAANISGAQSALDLAVRVFDTWFIQENNK